MPLSISTLNLGSPKKRLHPKKTPPQMRQEEDLSISLAGVPDRAQIRVWGSQDHRLPLPPAQRWVSEGSLNREGLIAPGSRVESGNPRGAVAARSGSPHCDECHEASGRGADCSRESQGVALSGLC